MLREQNANNHYILWNKAKEAMDQLNINQSELARRANINNTVVSALKLGKINKPSFELICKLADALEVDLNYFREEENNE